jgi:drug/metabolite transporter superfamily protein YnfA
MNYDYINCLIEVIGALLICKNVQVLYRDKIFKGVFLPTIVFFTMWGVWNLFYFPSINQHYSFYGGIFLCLSNLTWIGLVMYYKRRNK